MASASFMANLNPNPVSVASDIHVSKLGHSSSSSSLGQVKLPEWNSSLSSRKSVTAYSVAPKLVAPVMPETSSSLAHVWREIQGSNDWENLVQPLNPLLRDEIIRYGELVTACYKAFDFDPNSKRHLNCKYGKKSILKEVGLEESGYEVTKYIYATPDINVPIHNGENCSRWIGYVAVSNDDSVRRLGRRDIIVTFRGTVTNAEWIANFMSSLTQARLDPINSRPEVKVESGFLSLYTSEDSNRRFGFGSCREQLLSEVSRLINKYKGSEEVSITFAGHSMGSALALLLAYDIAELGLNTDSSNQKIPLTVYSFGGPRVGNPGFKERCEELGVKVLRVVNINDPITKLPGVLFNENFRVWGERYELPWSFSCYAHVGVELALDFFEMQNPSCVHDLETYITLLKRPQRVQVQRDGEDFINKAKEWLLSAQKLDTWSWQIAAVHIMANFINV